MIVPFLCAYNIIKQGLGVFKKPIRVFYFGGIIKTLNKPNRHLKYTKT
jgi:hypothetical protein